MAGQGIKLFVSGDVLSAAEINGYLMDQAVTRFATTTERDLAFGNAGQPTLSEGRICYIDSTNLIQFYDGTQWQDSSQFTVADGAVTSAKIADGAILNVDINASAAIAYSKLSLSGSIVNADVNASAAIADTKLATISTAGKVSNSATTATDANTASAIVARDASGNFSAETITANLEGVATYAAEWTLGANGNNHYTFTGPGLIGAEDDPTLHLIRGQQYKFTNEMGMHPFRIQSTPNGSAGTAYSDGITNNDVSQGTLTWNVQFDSPSVLYYQCTAHASMGGKIYIVEETASMIGTRTVFVQQATPTANATGDIWFQVTGL